MKKPPTKSLTSVDNLTCDDIVPYYCELIKWHIEGVGFPEPIRTHSSYGKEINRVNNLILSKWTYLGLYYIQRKAWNELNKVRNEHHPDPVTKEKYDVLVGTELKSR